MCLNRFWSVRIRDVENHKQLLLLLLFAVFCLVVPAVILTCKHNHKEAKGKEQQHPHHHHRSRLVAESINQHPAVETRSARGSEMRSGWEPCVSSSVSAGDGGVGDGWSKSHYRQTLNGVCMYPQLHIGWDFVAMAKEIEIKSWQSSREKRASAATSFPTLNSFWLLLRKKAYENIDSVVFRVWRFFFGEIRFRNQRAKSCGIESRKNRYRVWM